MIALRELQQLFGDGLRRGGTSGIAIHLADAPGGVLERFDIHRRNRIAALSNALRLTYPATEALVGSAFFGAVAEEFIGRHPPRGAELAGYGAEFAAFLGDHPQAAKLTYLSDVARLEWEAARCALSDAPRTRCEIGEFLMTAAPGLTLLAVSYPAAAIWRAALDGDGAALEAIDLCAAPSTLAIWRGEQGVSVAALSDAAASFLHEILRGGSAEAAALVAAQASSDAVTAITTEVFEADFVLLTPQTRETCDGYSHSV